ncbi:MAG: putative DNA binding domain-containing protein [Deltaproteobacteria bacterium]|nr:putative DNA binding domain-containing protein [Deltaproteobacteria bacterium]
MRDDELIALLDDIESDHVERKESIADGDKIRQAICAFANDLPDHKQPGVLFVGVNDAGIPTGQPITDQLLQNLASMRADGNILPFPSLTVQKRHLKGQDVAVVLIQPADAPPVRYKGTVWVRVGPRRAIASPQEERILAERRRYRDAPADIQPLRDVDIKELDQTLFKETYLPAAVSPDILAENTRTTEEQMASLRLVDLGPPSVPTVLGVLILGKRPSLHLPGAYVSFLRLAGEQLGSDVVSSHDIQGPLPRMMSQIDELLKLHIMTAVDITSGDRERRIPDFPLAALQQIVRNAVMHRIYEGTHAPVRIYWYSDRIEVISPGGPYGQVTRENFGRPGVNDYRNPNLAEAMRHLGYAQHFGVGIQIAREALARNGNPPPEFKFDLGPVMAIIRKKE